MPSKRAPAPPPAPAVKRDVARLLRAAAPTPKPARPAPKGKTK